MSDFEQFKQGVKLVALLQASLEQMDELKGTRLYSHRIKLKMNALERDIEAKLRGPLGALDAQDPELLTRIQHNVELVMAMDLEELAMLRAEIDEHRKKQSDESKI